MAFPGGLCDGAAKSSPYHCLLPQCCPGEPLPQSGIPRGPLPTASLLMCALLASFFLSLFPWVCVFPMPLVPGLHSRLSRVLTASPLHLHVLPAPSSLHLPVSISPCVRLSASLPGRVSAHPSLGLPLCLGLSPFLLPAPSPSCIIRAAPAASLSRESERRGAAEAVAVGEAEQPGEAGLAWGVESKLSGVVGKASARGPCACWGRPAQNSTGGGGVQGEVPP